MKFPELGNAVKNRVEPYPEDRQMMAKSQQ